jgi:hypothetical protein
MSDIPVFVNSVAVSGFSNGICNFAFSTARFIPAVDANGKPDGKVDLAEIITANLRMDLFCAQQLHDSLASILAQQTKPVAKDLQ